MGYLKVCLISVSTSLLITLSMYLYNLITTEKINYKDYIKTLLISLIVVSVTSGVVLETNLVESIQTSVGLKGDASVKSGGYKIKTISAEIQNIDTSPPNF